jgi:hypothetical protein
MDTQDVLCQGTGLDGLRCKRYRRAGGTTCKWHDPEDIEERAQALEEQAARIRDTAAVTA